MRRKPLKIATRVKNLPPYLFARIDEVKREVAASGVDIIDLGVGDPDMPTPQPIINAMHLAIDKPENHQYPDYAGSDAFRASCAKYMKNRTKIALDAKSEVLGVIGSKEAIAHLPVAMIDPGDIALVPSPCYPVYQTATRFNGGEPYFMPLLEENDFLPDLNKIPAKIWNKAKVLFLNYPNNPTGAVATEEFFTLAMEKAQKYGVLIAHDNAYFEIYSGRKRPLSILEFDGWQKYAIEFFSHSKTYNMTGWRIGFVAGAAEAINALGRVKNNMDSGQFTAVQDAAIAANIAPAKLRNDVRKVYAERRKAAVTGMKKAGFDLFDTGATFYLWAKIPSHFKTSADFAIKALEEAGVVVTPGNGFGDSGEGYFRLALCNTKARISEAIGRLKKVAE